MTMPTDIVEISLGPASLHLRPAQVWVWLELALAAPQPTAASLARLPAALLDDLLPPLCSPWLTPAEEAEMAALEDYLHAQADFPGLDCGACCACVWVSSSGCDGRLVCRSPAWRAKIITPASTGANREPAPRPRRHPPHAGKGS